MREASETAYKGVLKPVEGTILTVSRAVAEATEMARREDDDLLFILEHIVTAAKETVANTPNLLPVLKQAGVVDSGGQGLTVILEGMLRYLQRRVAGVRSGGGSRDRSQRESSARCRHRRR